MMDISRMPDSDICRVRGIGVAVRVSMCTSARRLLQRLLVLDPEVLLLVDDDQAQVLELDLLGQHRVGADHHLDLAGFQALPASPRRPWPAPGGTAGATLIGQPAKRSEKVLKCWRARSVVGQTTATC